MQVLFRIVELTMEELMQKQLTKFDYGFRMEEGQNLRFSDFILSTEFDFSFYYFQVLLCHKETFFFSGTMVFLILYFWKLSLSLVYVENFRVTSPFLLP